MTTINSTCEAEVDLQGGFDAVRDLQLGERCAVGRQRLRRCPHRLAGLVRAPQLRPRHRLRAS